MTKTFSGVVSFLTDYGLDDPYVGEVKAKMLSVCREIRVVDITHSVEPQNVLHGAFLLYLSYRFFPEGTVHLAVVDPGVGTERRGVVIATRRYWFVGPDNGLLYPAANGDGIVGCYEIELEGYRRYGGETFHGRDVFGPVAAELTCGMRPRMREVDPRRGAALSSPRGGTGSWGRTTACCIRPLTGTGSSAATRSSSKDTGGTEVKRSTAETSLALLRPSWPAA
jgi:S-adenosylmethionine hydrolase